MSEYASVLEVLKEAAVGFGKLVAFLNDFLLTYCTHSA